MRDKNKKTILLIALIAVCTVSIGFATFSSSLLIKSGLSIAPDSSTFKILFSTDSSSVKGGSVSPTISPSSVDITAESATINNDGLYPTISGLEATLTEAGQSVSYSFYAINHPDYSKYDAYLTSIVLQAKTDGNFITCESEDGTTSTAINQACNNISVSVKVGSESAVTSTKLGIENHILSQNSSELVTITLSYGGTELIDEKFNVKIGNIYLTYGTQMTSEMPNLPTGSCQLVSGTGSNVGDQIACGNENFYVIESTTNTVTMLAAKNITLPTTVATGSGGEYPKQSDSAGTLKFSDSIYWYPYTVDGYVEYPLYVYDSNSNLYPYVEAYEKYLKSLGATSADAKVPSVQQMEKLGCSWESGNNGAGEVCRWYGNNSWIYTSNYWLGSAGARMYDDNVYTNMLWAVEKKSHGGSMWFGANYAYGVEFGIRPVVTISTDEIG